MKSRMTSLPQMVLTSIALITISIACSGDKSAGSRPLANNTGAATPTADASQTQEKASCSLTLAAAPSIAGVKVGMTKDQVLALFPGSKEDRQVQTLLTRPPSEFGESELVIQPLKYESKDPQAQPKLGDVNHVIFSFLDDRVSSFSIGYNGPRYSHVDQFVTKVIADMNLPALADWQAYVGMDNQLKILKCAEFEVRVFAGGQGGNLNYVLVKDLEAEKKLEERRAKARAQATPTP